MEINEFDFLEDIVEAQEKLESQQQNADNQDDKDADAPADKPAEEDNDTKADDTEEDSDGSAAPYEAYYNFLKEQGAITTPEDFQFDGTEEGFLKAIEASKEQQYKNVVAEMWNSLPEQGRPLLEYFMAGGTDVNKYIQAYTDLDLDKIDLEEEDNQLKVLRQYYKEIFNYTDEKTDRILTRLQAKDGLKEGAQDAIEDLKEHKATLQADLVKNAQKEQQTLRENAEKERKMISQSIKNLDSSKQSKIEALLFNPVKYEDSVTTEFNYYLNKISSNPAHLVQLADLLIDYNPEKGFNLERFEQRVVSNKTKSLKALIDSKADPRKQTTQGSSSPKEETSFPFDKFFNL